MSEKRIKINFEDFWHSNSTDNIISKNPFYSLLLKRYKLEISKIPDFLIYSCFGKNHLKYNCIKIFYAGENVRPNFNECDYAFSFDYSNNIKNYRLPLFKLEPEYNILCQRKGLNADDILEKKTKFCNFIYSNKKATERINFFNRLNSYKKVDSGGKVLNNIGYFVNNKIEFMKNFKFTIVFENSSYPGYTTEKILHAYLANTIPIYWGNPLIEKDFNACTMIHCKNASNFDEVVEKIIEIDNDDNLFKSYIEKSPINNIEQTAFSEEEQILNKFDEIFNYPVKSALNNRLAEFKYYIHYLMIKYPLDKIKFLRDWLNNYK